MMTKKILLFLVLLTVLFVLWIIGGEQIYANFLKSGINLLLTPFSQFRAETLVQNNHTLLYFYDLQGPAEQDVISQNLEFLSLPIILLIAWSVQMLIFLPIQKIWKTAFIQVLGFYLLQLFYFLFLLGKMRFAWADFVYNAFLHSFGIMVLFIIIWNELTFKLFNFTYPKKDLSSAK